MKTELLRTHPAIVHHQLTQVVDETEMMIGVRQALDVIRGVVKDGAPFDLLLDFTKLNDTSEYNLAAHRAWSLHFKQSDLVAKNVRRIAVVAQDSLRFRAEQELMQTETVRFLTDFDEALEWLESRGSLTF